MSSERSSNNKQAPVTKINQLSETEQAVLKCKQCRDNIKGLIKRLEKTAAQKKDKAKELLKNKDRERAKIYVKQSKFHSEQIKVASKQLEMVEDQITSIETASQLSEVMKVLQNGNIALKKIQEEIKVEKWEAISDDMQELKQQQDEIGEFFKQYNVDQTEYDNNVNSELEKLEKVLGLGGEVVKDNNKEKEKKDKNKDKEILDFPEANKEEIVKNKEVKEEDKNKEKVKKKEAIAA